MITDLRFQVGSRVCPGPGARSAGTLGAGGSRPALQDAPARTGRSGQTGRIARCSPSGRCRSSRKTASSCSNPGPSCCISANGARRCCRRTRAPATRATQWLIAALNSIEPLRHERRLDRSLLRERGVGEATPARGGGVRAEAPVRALQVARRQALPRRRPLHRR